MLEWIVLAMCLPCSWLITRWMLGYAHSKNLLDVPDYRSSHRIPTATGGGVAIVITFLAYLIWAALLDGVSARQALALGICGGIIAIIGFADDHFRLSVLIRIVVQFIAVSLLLFLLYPLPPIPIFDGFWANQYALTVFYLLALVWLLNLFNFMDGIDGLAAIEAISVLLGAALIMSGSNASTEIRLLLSLLFSVVGFGCLNWPPAKIFMGDVGSGFIGLMLGALALITTLSGLISIWSWLILLAVFIADATVTLIRRLMHGQKVYEAHKSHAYQIVARKWQSHGKTSLCVMLTNLIWLMPLAYLATLWPGLGFAIALLAYSPLVLLSIKLGAGRVNH